MKKLLLIIAAVFTLTGVHADLILHESFDRELGQLTAGRRINCNDSTKWWSYAGWTGSAEAPTDPIMVTEGSLSYPGYAATATGNKVQLQQVNGTSDVRYFREHKEDNYEGSVYAAAIVNVESATSTVDYFFGLSNGYTTCSRIYAKAENSGFQLAIAKGTELKTDLQYTQTLKYNTDYLVVLEYVIKKGNKNDSVNLYVNPTKDRQVPTLVCNMELANEKSDVASISGVYLRQKTNGPKVAVDEIKVATAWEDLFTDGGDKPQPVEPAIAVTNKIDFNYVYTSDIEHDTIEVLAENLTAGITITCDNAELTLDRTTLTKEEAEAGAKIVLTLKPEKENQQNAVVTFTSGDLTETTNVTWYTSTATGYKTIAEIKQRIADQEAFSLWDIRFTGEAIVTYVEDENTFYIEDETGAICVKDDYQQWYMHRPKVGDRITKFSMYNGEKFLGSFPVVPNTAYTLLSQNNEITPQVTTVAELLANPMDYYLEVVKLKKVVLDLSSTIFTKGNNAVSQGESTTNIQLTEDNTLIGTNKPQYADVIGLSFNTAGSAIRVRSAADIVAVTGPTTSIDNVALDLLNGDYEIYTVSGQRIDALQSGINIIRQGNNTYKVVR